MAFLGTITRAIISFFVSKEVCFNGDGIGCFSNKKPFDNALRKLPQSPGDQHVCKALELCLSSSLCFI